MQPLVGGEVVEAEAVGRVRDPGEDAGAPPLRVVGVEDLAVLALRQRRDAPRAVDGSRVAVGPLRQVLGPPFSVDPSARVGRRERALGEEAQRGEGVAALGAVGVLGEPGAERGAAGASSRARSRGLRSV
nr:hypothetical protein GCM10025732_28790 [Glycomyces mayteni]